METATDAPTPGPSASLRGRVSSRGERLLESGLLACAFISVLAGAGIVAVLALESVEFLRVVSPWALLDDVRWAPLPVETRFGIWPLVSGTLLTAAIAMAVALPFGLLSAIYLSEFAPGKLRRWLGRALEMLAGIPTLVYGYFALVVVTPALGAVVPGLASESVLGAGLVLGVMLIPTISSLAGDALSAVPQSLREGAYALGAARLPTLLRVVLPSAGSAIAASVILALSRAVGETMIVAIVAIAAGQRPRLTLDPRAPIETMTACVVHVGTGEMPTGSLEHRTLFVVGALLFVMTFAMNASSHWLRRRSGRAA